MGRKTWMLIPLVLLCLAVLLAGCAETNPTPNPGPDGATTTTAAAGGVTTGVTYKDIDGVVADALPAAYFGEYYYAELSISSGTGPFSCKMAAGSSLPGEIAFEEGTCYLGGEAPEAAAGTTKGVYPFSFTVTDSTGKKSGPYALSLTLTSKPPTFSAVDELSIPAKPLEPFSYDFCQGHASSSLLYCGNDSYEVYGGVPPYTFSVSGQPLGLFMKPNGSLEGTIPEHGRTGNYTMKVCVADSVKSETCHDVILPVAPKLLLPGNLSCRILRVIKRDESGNPKYDVVSAEFTISGKAYAAHPDSMFFVSPPAYDFGDIVDFNRYKSLYTSSDMAGPTLSCGGWTTIASFPKSSLSDRINNLGCENGGGMSDASWSYSLSVVNFRYGLDYSNEGGEGVVGMDAMRESLRDKASWDGGDADPEWEHHYSNAVCS